MRFKKWIYKLLGWDLVEIEHGNFFTMGFDCDTQTFRKVLFYEDTQKFEFEREEYEEDEKDKRQRKVIEDANKRIKEAIDNTDARAVAAKVCNIL